MVFLKIKVTLVYTFINQSSVSFPVFFLRLKYITWLTAQTEGTFKSKREA